MRVAIAAARVASVLRPALTSSPSPAPLPSVLPVRGTVRVIADGRITHGAYTLLETRAEAGSTTSAHRHEREDQSILVLAGELTVVIDGEPTTLPPGGHALLPREIPHRTVAGPDGAHFLCVCTPAGYEDVVRAIQDARLDPDDLAAVLAAAGVHAVAVRW